MHREYDPPLFEDDVEPGGSIPAHPEDQDSFHNYLSNLLLVASSFHISETGPGRAYQKLTDGLVQALPFKRGLMFLLEDDRFVLKSLSWENPGAAALGEVLARHPGQILPDSPEWESFEMGRALPVPLQYSGFFPLEAATALGLEQEIILVPLVDEDGITGVLAADYADGGEKAAGSGDLALLETYAGLAGALLANTRLYSELKRKYVELRIINAVTRALNQSVAADQMAANILGVLTHSMEAQAGFLLSLDGEAGQARLVTQVGLSGPEVERLQSLPTPGQEDIQAMRREGRGGKRARFDISQAEIAGHSLLKPLDLAGRPVGLLGLVRDAELPDFEPEEEATLDSVHDHVSLAINSLRLRRIATTDELTGLFTRRYFLESLDQQLSLGRRLEFAVTLLMLDLDHFKRVNDTHGHQAGDAVLRAVGACLKSGTREGDVCARYGGEELAVVLSHCDAASGRALAEKLRKKIANLQVEHQGALLGVTVSIGLASQEVGGSLTGAELIGRADQALYQSKECGRDQVCPWAG